MRWCQQASTSGPRAGIDVWRRIPRLPHGLHARVAGPIAGGGAGDEVRTRDIQLGRLTLYQLSYSRPARQTRGYSTYPRAPDLPSVRPLRTDVRCRSRAGAGPEGRSLVKLSNLLVVAAVIGAVFGVAFVVASSGARTGSLAVGPAAAIQRGPDIERGGARCSASFPPASPLWQQVVHRSSHYRGPGRLHH